MQADYLEYSVDFGDGLRGEVGLMSYVAGVIAEQLDSLEQGGMGRPGPEFTSPRNFRTDSHVGEGHDHHKALSQPFHEKVV